MPTRIFRETISHPARRGVTLVEVLVVVSILALVSGAVGLAVFHYKASAERKLAETDARSIRQAVRTATATGELQDCPSYDELRQRELVEGGSRGQDPWQRPYELRCPQDSPRNVVVTSAGPDRKLGTEDDIVVSGD